MTVVQVVGWLATAVGMSLGLPQLLKLLRTRNVEGLSLFAWQATLVVNVIWLVHGLRIEQPPQWLTNVFALSTTLPLVVLLTRARRVPLVRTLWPALASAAVIIGIDVLFGSAIYGLAAIPPAIAATGGQSVELVRAEHVKGVSAMFTIGAFVNQCLWLAFAFLIADAGSIIATTIPWAITGFNLVWYGLRLLGLRAFDARSPALVRVRAVRRHAERS